MNSAGKAWLTVGAGLNFAIALIHLGIIFAGGPAYVYFGAADLAVLAQAGSPVPALLTVCLTIVFIVFGVYALSGAGVVRRLPLLRLGLLAIGAVYTLRGLIVILDILRLVRGAGYPFRQTVFSAAALAIGLIYLIGTIRRCSSLQT
jgi:hypothetical protein